ncbi:hypothetical protein GCM10011507_04310 [Edaphobacter acidisoli]|uniref:Negative regulator of flagellin synthesis n=1 Tax=Edaphobacter acidisoli TaxID=2040573 RepID=A0A916RJF2_9BACT|nr:flagellar biosynthesis anti-sigma factor FlgM [Edaphobacter acidisoli]GGA56154.1 hypothetical protein GCM10011507_04310 [Edaphobacter acidisoli]
MSVTNGIGNLQQTTGTSATEAAAHVSGSAVKAKGTAETRSEQTDHAELSTAGSLISKALGGSDVRMGKVQALQQAIASGSYQVSSSDVADKLVDSMME